jgi:alkanesulfonate monooxygenase SsuD/methylene tetrahydromethanopterin reductase-like flavin-dependent oxidoreductase (luciferase family)
VTVFAFTSVDPDPAAARQALRPKVAASMSTGRIDAQIAPVGILPQVRELLESGGQARLEAEMPDEWIDRLSIVGTPEDCKLAIQRLGEAGADTVVLVPVPGRGLDELELFARDILRQ